MYSFEGQYRRIPQQKLSGACSVLNRDELVARAKEQRQEREQQRRKLQCCVLIQAYCRSFICRSKTKRQLRKEFDELTKDTAKLPFNEKVTELAIRKLLFFYYAADDKQRLLYISHLVLREHSSILKLAAVPKSVCRWQMCKLLALNLDVLAETRESVAVPLRLLEIFTCVKTASEAVGDVQATQLVTTVLSHLVARGYFSKLKMVLESKCPLLEDVSPHPPSPLVASVFDLITRPLQLDNSLNASDFRILMQKMCADLLCTHFSEPLRYFLIPALVQLPRFPFQQFNEAILELHITNHSPGLLLTLLSLEKRHFTPNSSCLQGLIYYLQALASLSTNLPQLSASKKQDDDEDDEQVEMEVETEEQRQNIEILEECVELLNNESRVHILLSTVDETNEPLVLNALCQICHNLLLSCNLTVHNSRLLYMLAFKPAFLRQLWSAVSTVSQTSAFGYSTPLVHLIAVGTQLSSEEAFRVVPLLAVFCALFTLLLTTLDDTEFYGDQPDDLSSKASSHHTNPFKLSELVSMSEVLKEVSVGLVNLAFPDSRISYRDGMPTSNKADEHSKFWENLFKVVVKLVRQLHDRDNHRQFCPDGHWLATPLTFIECAQPLDLVVRRRVVRGYRPFHGIRAFTREDMEVEGPPLSTKEVRSQTLLHELPFFLPFENRVVIFQSIVLNDKINHQGEAANFLHGPSIQICVRRNYLYEDAFDRLSPSNEPELRLKMRVELVNTAGMNEAGVDGGGLLREFLTELLKTAFDPNRGFFKLTNNNMLYPNPSVSLIVRNYCDHYFFIGRVLGKALYESLLVELPLAEFFLQKCVSRNADVDIHNLESLDPVLYKNLLFLKNYDGDVQDLGLDFTVLTEELGERRTEELKRNGSSTLVTNSNRIEYIHLMADYKLNKQIRQQCAAFRAGLTSVIPLEWICMFNCREMQLLISGAQVPVDINDLRKHTEYAGGYSLDHPTIRIFWQVVSDFTDSQKGLLLKFVTSCSRPPLLGFKELEPQFCIQLAGSSDRLPTASTCMNLLKLPEFSDEQLLREKLIYAITAGAGFELS